MNLAIIQGNLGADPDLRTTQGGESVVTLSVATNERWTDRDGTKQEHTEWHRVVVWGAQAKACGEYLRKGAAVLVQGSIRTRKWEDKDGVERYSTEIKAQHVEFLSRSDSGAGRRPPHPGDGGQGRYGGGKQDQGGGAPPLAGGTMDDDIPF